MRKKVQGKLIGSETLMNPKTGELNSYLVIEKEVKSELPLKWRRVVVDKLFEIMDKSLSTQKMKVLYCIIENLNSDNQLINTQKEIAKATKVSEPTVSSLFKSLIANDFMKKKGHYFIINPAVIGVFGDEKKNLDILIRYRAI